MQFLEDEPKTSKAGQVETRIIEQNARKAGISGRTLERAQHLNEATITRLGEHSRMRQYDRPP